MLAVSLDCPFFITTTVYLVFCVVFHVLFVFVLCLVYPRLPVSLDCPFFIATTVYLVFCVVFDVLFVPSFPVVD